MTHTQRLVNIIGNNAAEGLRATMELPEDYPQRQRLKVHFEAVLGTLSPEEDPGG